MDSISQLSFKKLALFEWCIIQEGCPQYSEKLLLVKYFSFPELQTEQGQISLLYFHQINT